MLTNALISSATDSISNCLEEFTANRDITLKESAHRNLIQGLPDKTVHTVSKTECCTHAAASALADVLRNANWISALI